MSKVVILYYVSAQKIHAVKIFWINAHLFELHKIVCDQCEPVFYFIPNFSIICSSFVQLRRPIEKFGHGKESKMELCFRLS